MVIERRNLREEAGRKVAGKFLECLVEMLAPDRVGQQATDHGIASGVTTTAGGLAFTTTTDGTVYALDDETLKPLWSFNTGSFSSAPPMTYAVNGKQYVAVLIGGNAQTRDLLNKTPSLKDMQNTSMLFVFSL